MKANKQYWLLKTEPEEFSIDDLARAANQTTFWDGVRNYQARNLLRDKFALNDQVLIYHSNADPPSLVGIAKVVRTGYPDHTAWDPKNPHYDPKSTPDDPRWHMVDIQFVRKLDRAVPLDELRTIPQLAEMELLRRGSRLSVQPVRPIEFETIVKKYASGKG